MELVRDGDHQGICAAALSKSLPGFWGPSAVGRDHLGHLLVLSGALEPESGVPLEKGQPGTGGPVGNMEGRGDRPSRGRRGRLHSPGRWHRLRDMRGALWRVVGVNGASSCPDSPPTFPGTSPCPSPIPSPISRCLVSASPDQPEFRYRPVPVLLPAPGWLVSATGLDSAAASPKLAGSRYRIKFPLPWGRNGPGHGIGTVPSSPGPARPLLPRPPLPRRRAPGTGEESRQQHQHWHRHSHVHQRSNGRGRRAQRPRRSAGVGTGGSAGRWEEVWGTWMPWAARSWGLRSREAPTGVGRCRDAPERETVAPMGLEAPGEVGRDVLPSHLWAWGGS